METCKTIVLAQPEAGDSVNYEIPTTETAQLSFGADQISGIKLNDFGALEISFADGGSATLTNFQDLVDNGNLLYLNDGTLIDPAILTGALGGTEPLSAETSDIVTIVGPADNVTREINLESGQKYVLDFDFAQPETAEVVDGNMVITFANQGILVLNDYEKTAEGETPAELSLASSNTIISGEELLTSLELAQAAPSDEELAFEEEEETEDVRKTEIADADLEGQDDVGAGDETDLGYEVAAVEPASGTDEDLDSIAEALQQVEPAAGENGGGDNGRLRFVSTPGSEPLGSIDDVGPINPTQLQYEAPEFGDENVGENEETPAGPIDDNPILSGPFVNNLDETNLDGGPLTDSGSITVDFGNDGPGSIYPNGGVMLSGSLPNPDLESGGEIVTISEIIPGYFGGVTGEGYIGTLPNGDVVFTLIIDPDTGEYTYTQYEPFDHADPTDDNDVISMKFGVTAEDSDGDKTSTTITINVADDAPAVAAPDENTVSESLLKSGDIVINDTLVIDFGQDVEGTVTPTGTAPSVSGTTGLTSAGEAITITATADGYVGTLAGGGVAFTLEIDPTDGSYVYTQKVPLDHNAANDTISVEFPVTVTDFDGDTTTTTITVNITDSVPEFGDKPKLGDGLEIVDETDLPGVTVSGQLTVDFGADLPGAVTANDTFSFSGSALGGNLTSGGETVNVELVGDTYVGFTGADVNANRIFTLQVDADGSYTFELLGTLDHADPNDPNDIIDLTFGVTATDGDGDTDSTTIVVKVKDDVPTIGDAHGDVDETNLDNGPISTSDVVDISLGVEIGSISPDGNVVATVGGTPIALTSAGDTVVFEQTTAGYKGTINGGTETVFEITIDQDGTYTYTQFAPFDHPDGTDPNDIIDLAFGVQVVSTDSDSDTGTISIAVADDGPVAVDDVNGAEEGQTITGSVTANDDFSTDVDNTVTQVEFNGTTYAITAGTPAVVNTPVGQLTLHADGSYEFDTVDSGDPDATVTFTYTLVDEDGDSDTAELSLIITPDGQPIAVTEEMTVDETNLHPGPLVINETMDVDFGLDGQGSIDPNGTVSVNGSVAGGTLTSDGRPVEIIQTTNGYQGVLTGTTTVIFELIVQDNGDYSFELFDSLDHADATDPNDLIQFQFGVTVSDSDGDTAPGTITVNVLDDAPVAYDDSNMYDITNGGTDGNVVTGRNGGPGAEDVLSEDAENEVIQISFEGNTVDVPADGSDATIEGEFGILKINKDGEYTYELKPGVTTGGGSATLDPNSGDVAGTQSTITKNGITVTAGNGQDLRWVSQDGAGIGIAGGSDKVWPSGETMELTFEQNVQSVELTIADIGSNNLHDGIDFKVYLASDPTTPIYGEVGVENLTVVDSKIVFTIDASDYGTDAEIVQVDVFSTDAGQYGAASFLLHDVTVEYGGEDCLEDQFEYVLRDGDGDTDTAILDLKGKDLTNDTPVIVEPIKETVDETDLGPVVEDGTVQANFFGEGPGTIAGNDTFTFDGSAKNGQLTSHGVAVVVTQLGDKYVGMAGSTTVFELTVDNDGDYSFTLFDVLDHADTTDHDDVINLHFGVVATDKDGDTDTADITICVKDDGPYISDKFGHVEESGLVNGPISTTRPIDHDFGEDGPGQIEGNGIFMKVDVMDGPATTLKSGGQEVIVTKDGNGYIGQVGTTTIFTLTIDPATGEHTYTQYEPLDHTEGHNPADDVFWLKFGVDIVDYDGDTDSAFIIVDIHDGEPVAKDDTDSVTENEVSTDGNVITNDMVGPDESGSVTNVKFGTNDMTTVPAGGSVTISGQYGDLTIYSNGNYTYTITAANVPDTAQEVFIYELTDFDGDTDTANLTLDIVGRDDCPVLVQPAKEIVDETDLGPVTRTGDLEANFFGDGPGTFMATNTFTSGGSRLDNKLTSGGVDVDVTLDGNTYTGKAGTETIFTLEVQPNGHYEFNLIGTLDHADGTDPDDIIVLNFGVKAVDKDGDSDDGNITVKVKDDGPSISDRFGHVDEDDLVNGPLVRTRDIDFDYGADGPGSIKPNGTVMKVNVFDGDAVPLTYCGKPVEVTQTDNGYVGMVGSVLIFTLTIDPANGTNTYTQYEALDHTEGHNPGDDVFWIKFGVDIMDADGDTDSAFVIVDVHDSEPVANTDVNVFDGMMTTGNVIEGTNGGDNGADIKSQDDPTLVNQISFDDVTKAVTNGDVTIDGQFGTLTINEYGDYKYVLNDNPNPAPKQTVYHYNVKCPSNGVNHTAGTIQEIDTTYNKTTNEFTFELVIRDPSHADTDGFTLALNGGPNPKGSASEMALFYFDASGDGTPIITVYSYNGENTQTSYYDGSPQSGTQAADPITSSLLANSPFTSITETTDAHGNRVFSFTMDATIIQEHDPLYGDTSEWTGASFGEQIGMWMHPVGLLDTEYDSEGYLTNWSAGKQGWYDVSYKPTETEMICPCSNDFDPEKSDIGYGNSSVTLDGITVSVGDPIYNNLEKGTLNWVDAGDGAGIGIRGNGSSKVWQPGEVLEVTFDEAPAKVTLDIADIGSNNVDDGLDFKIYLQGQSQPVEYEFDINTANPQDGVLMNIEIDAADFGGQLIDKIEVFSINNSDLGTASFLLNGVHAECPPETVAGTDIFEYQIVDKDGDTDSAFLVFNSATGEGINGTDTAEVLQGTSLDDVVYSAGGDDDLFGGDGKDVFVFLKIDDGHDTIKDFNGGEDSIDLSKLLDEYNPLDDAISDFVYTSHDNGDTTISVDVNGTGDQGNAVDVVTLEGTVIDLDQLLGQDNLVA